MKTDAEPSGKISIQDAIRLKHELNKGITYHGYGARELTELIDKSPDWKNVRARYAAHQGQWESIIVRSNVAAVACYVAVFALMYAGGYFRLAGWALIAYMAYSGVGTQARLDGYLQGYETGYSDRITNELGISLEEQLEAHEQAREMEIDERMIRAFEKR